MVYARIAQKNYGEKKNYKNFYSFCVSFDTIANTYSRIAPRI